MMEYEDHLDYHTDIPVTLGELIKELQLRDLNAKSSRGIEFPHSSLDHYDRLEFSGFNTITIKQMLHDCTVALQCYFRGYNDITHCRKYSEKSIVYVRNRGKTGGKALTTKHLKKMLGDIPIESEWGEPIESRMIDRCLCGDGCHIPEEFDN